MPARTLIVLAKAPRPGASKTRLCPPATPRQAADVARAALRETLTTVSASSADRRVLVLDGVLDGPSPEGFEVLAQRGDGLAERLADAFEDVGAPALLIGMDTPHVTPSQLDAALARLAHPDVDAVLGASLDGGYWAIGLSAPQPGVFTGVPMSAPSTCAAQRARLRALGLRTAELEVLRDVDFIDDARSVACLMPGSGFARAVAAVA